jgi:Skp family chaperone for outer membrane proteins
MSTPNSTAPVVPATPEVVTSDAPVVEAAAPITSPTAPPEELDIEALINTAFSDDEVLADLSITHKVGRPAHEVVSELPKEARMVVQNLRSSYSRKMNELATLKKELEAERTKLAEQTKLLTDSDFTRQLREKAEDTTELDPYDDEQRQRLIEREAARNMGAVLEPLKREVEAQARRKELLSFKENNPELNDPEVKAAVVDVLKANEHMRLEEAFYMVQGKRLASERAAKAAEEKALRESRAATFSKTSPGRNVTGPVGTPEFASPAEAYRYFAALKGITVS